MKTNHIDKIVKEKLAERTFQPSVSAWERLSVSLDEKPKQQKKPLFLIWGIAASILLCISFGVGFFLNSDTSKIPDQEIVIQPNVTNTIKNNIDEILNKTPQENVIVDQSKIKNNSDGNRYQSKKINQKNSKNEHYIIAISGTILTNDKTQEDTISSKRNEEIFKNPSKILESKSSIKVNSADLLYAVTHNSQEVKSYYAKYQLDRSEVLKFIKNELKSTNIKMEPSIILAEVERSIGEEDFQNNFMKLIKKKVVDIAQAIATRND